MLRNNWSEPSLDEQNGIFCMRDIFTLFILVTAMSLGEDILLWRAKVYLFFCSVISTVKPCRFMFSLTKLLLLDCEKTLLFFIWKKERLFCLDDKKFFIHWVRDENECTNNEWTISINIAVISRKSSSRSRLGWCACCLCSSLFNLFISHVHPRKPFLKWNTYFQHFRC